MRGNLCLRSSVLSLVVLLAGASSVSASCDPFNPRPDPSLDLNCDGRTVIYCGTDYGPIDRYDNALVEGFMVLETGTYVLIGDVALDGNANGVPDYLEPDGNKEHFFLFNDIGGPSGFPDGQASFDPSLVGLAITTAGEYGDPAACNGQGACDSIIFVPEGDASGLTNGDAQVKNPNCDFFSQDIWESCILLPIDTISVMQTALLPVPGFVEVVRGAVDQLAREVNGVNLATVTCLGALPQGSTFTDTEMPPVGESFFYVAQFGDGSTYPYGFSGDGFSGGCVPRFIAPGNGCCGDGLCDVSEDQCSCNIDCGAPPLDEVGSCTDGIDNDCDGVADCSDNDCASICCGNGICDPADDVCSCGDCGPPPATETICDNGRDDDCDSGIDCSDDDCASTCCGNGICDSAIEDCSSCSDCPGQSGGPPSDRFCCGDGIIQPPELDGDPCDGVF